MYKEGDKVYFKKGSVWADGDVWYEGVIDQPYKNQPVFMNGVYSIKGTNLTIHCFASPDRLKPREE